MSHTTEPFPQPFLWRGRLHFVHHVIENHKRRLAGLPELPVDPTAPIKLRLASEVSADYRFSRRTLGRLIAGRVVNLTDDAA